jgi:hypothetical protein
VKATIQNVNEKQNFGNEIKSNCPIHFSLMNEKGHNSEARVCLIKKIQVIGNIFYNQ